MATTAEKIIHWEAEAEEHTKKWREEFEERHQELLSAMEWNLSNFRNAVTGVAGLFSHEDVVAADNAGLESIARRIQVLRTITARHW